jgi:DNA-binding response OmpR family regulator
VEWFSPDIIIIDCDGTPAAAFALIEEIRECSGAPIVLLTSQSPGQDYDTALGLGVDELIQKPFEGRVFQARVRALLRRYSMNTGETAAENGLPCRLLRLT